MLIASLNRLLFIIKIFDQVNYLIETMFFINFNKKYISIK